MAQERIPVPCFMNVTLNFTLATLFLAKEEGDKDAQEAAMCHYGDVRVPRIDVRRGANVNANGHA